MVYQKTPVSQKKAEGLNEDIQEQKKQCKTEKNKGQNDEFKFYLISSYIKSKLTKHSK